MEEEYIQQICEDIIRIKPDLVFTEKGVSGMSHIHTHTHTVLVFSVSTTILMNSFVAVSDLAQHYLMKANITAIRRIRKTDNNRIAR